jgi:hypothetical protein
MPIILKIKKFITCLLLLLLICSYNNYFLIEFADARESYLTQGEIYSFLFAVFNNKNDTLRRWDNDAIGIRIYHASEEEEKLVDAICILLTKITSKNFKRYYRDDIILEFDPYFNKQMYGDTAIGISSDYNSRVLKINRIVIDTKKTAKEDKSHVILHEFLHAIGYKVHSIDPKSIMYPYILPGQDLTEQDLTIIRILYDPIFNFKNGMTYNEVIKILYGKDEIGKQKDTPKEDKAILEKYNSKKIDYKAKNYCAIEGIVFYDNKNCSAAIDGNIYHINDSVCGGKIAAIFPEKIRIKFRDKEKDFQIGHNISERP